MVFQETAHSVGGVVFQRDKVVRLKGVYPDVSELKWSLVLHKPHDSDQTAIPHWGPPKGMLELGDEDEDRAVAEVVEEALLNAVIVAYLDEPVVYEYQYQGRRCRKRVDYYLMESLGRAGGVRRGPDIKRSKFFPTDEVSDILTQEDDIRVFDKARVVYDRIAAERNLLAQTAVMFANLHSTI